MIMLNLGLIWLRSKGYYQEVSSSHMHDISKWMFAISMLWSYLWVSQFLLIWYANIPEEVTYYTQRFFSDYQVPFLITFFVNFRCSFLHIIAERHQAQCEFYRSSGVAHLSWALSRTCICLSYPGRCLTTMNSVFLRVALFLGFLGLYFNRTLSALSKAPLIPKNHPMLQESKELHY